MSSSIKNLHVYASDGSHSDVWIAGTRDGLIALRNSIDEALENDEKHDSAFVATPNDGECHNFFIMKVDVEQFDDLTLPYITKHEGWGHTPFTLMGGHRYAQLVKKIKAKDA